jgi:hypothetical protein
MAGRRTSACATVRSLVHGIGGFLGSVRLNVKSLARRLGETWSVIVQPSPWTLRIIAAVAVVAAAVAAVVVVASGRRGAPADNVIEVPVSRCGQGWTRPRTGPQTFELRNSDSRTAEVDLVDPTTGAVYGEVEGLAPGTTRPMQVLVGQGT